MARTKIGESQVLDSDFLSEDEHDITDHTTISGIPRTLIELNDTPAAYDVDKYLKSTISGTEWSTVSGISGGGGLTWTVISGTTTAVNNFGYLINASNNDVVLSLPSSPSEGDTVGFCDFYDAALANDITISGSGSNIEGSSEPLVVDVIGAAGTLVYTDSARGWEIVSEINNAINADMTTTFNYNNYVDRGDPSAYDFTQADLTLDAAWYDLDLSSIIPSNATAVILRILITDDGVESYIRFRKNGNSNTIAPMVVRTQVANVAIESTLIIPCDTSQVIEYSASSGCNSIVIVVQGWFTANDETVVGVSATTFNYQNYIDRGDPSSWDFEVADFTTDGTWKELDLSSIVPSNAVAVNIKVQVLDDTVGSYLRFRTNGNSNEVNRVEVATQTLNFYSHMCGTIALDSNKKIGYKGSNVTFTYIFLTISGWFTEDDQTAVGSGNVYSPSDLTDNALIRGDGGAKNVQTTPIIVSDNGEMTNPSQPHFEAYVNTIQSNVTGDGTAFDITGAFWTEWYDYGNNFSNGTFTAPVTGRYLFNVDYYLTGLAAAHTMLSFRLVTSNNTYYPHQLNPQGLVYTTANILNNWSKLIVMDADDVAYLTVVVSNGTKVVDVGATYTIFTGMLIG